MQKSKTLRFPQKISGLFAGLLLTAATAAPLSAQSAFNLTPSSAHQDHLVRFWFDGPDEVQTLDLYNAYGTDVVFREVAHPDATPQNQQAVRASAYDSGAIPPGESRAFTYTANYEKPFRKPETRFIGCYRAADNHLLSTIQLEFTGQGRLMFYHSGKQAFDTRTQLEVDPGDDAFIEIKWNGGPYLQPDQQRGESYSYYVTKENDPRHLVDIGMPGDPIPMNTETGFPTFGTVQGFLVMRDHAALRQYEDPVLIRFAPQPDSDEVLELVIRPR
ncbi:MAG: hypothetical protein AAF570_07620 [Bacteroidota bacterium]